MRVFCTIFFIFLNLISLCVFGLNLTLTESIDIALKENPQVLISKQQVREAEGKRMQAVSPMLPQINSNLSFSYYNDYPYANFNKNWELSNNLSQNVFTGGKYFFGAKAANEGVKIAREGNRLTKQQIIFRVTQAFYEVLFAKRVLSINEEALKLAEEDHRVTKARYEQGEASNYDLLRTEVLVAAEKPKVIQSGNFVKTTLNNLKLLLGIDPLENVELDGSFAFEPLDMNMNNLLSDAKGQRPEIRQAESGKSASKYLSWAARAGYVPNLSFNLTNYMAQKYAFSQFIPRNSWDDYWIAQLSLNIPIFDGLNREAKIKETNAKRLEASIADSFVKDQVSTEVENAYLTVKAAEEIVLSQRKNVDRAEQAYKIIWERYGEGMASQLDILDAQHALSQARLDYARGLFEHIVAKARLNLAVGKD